MRVKLLLSIVFACVSSQSWVSAQTIPKEELTFLTSEWKGERFPDGRPKISDNLLERAKKIGLDDAWQVLKVSGYLNQFEHGWKTLNDEIITGRAVTAMYMPNRPDLEKNIKARGVKQGRVGNTNTWPIAVLNKGDVYVADAFGKINGGTLIGSTLATSIFTNSGNGVILNGAARDVPGLEEIKGFNAFVRDFHPSFMEEMLLMGLNTPIRIGGAIVMPGDLVIAAKIGVLFVPAHLAEQVVSTAEFVVRRDKYAFEVIKSGKYTGGQLDNAWTEEMKLDFLKWMERHPEEGKMTKAELDVIMSKRTW
ncbi:MAG: dimethylmenaquinone methyltransferase [Sphingobacteriales bacterium 17-39-43]|uniref:RraA family protein n=1 Tax=Daejeonella sp. TaxID=2805397 RepID=UPI000BCAD0C8|nr:RraA family protein [Daejeonella sp.]OYZ32787.1 MAG: dimethylmenaquinone methyltransferase [Sphingobacteriales bacterium 16-39-50]OZA26197.1 MAG: dimethylmenaquinone methyltransferase [Sphingobacteriales bacterium 17-39-43]HQT23137.1 RraA family protein [Daejeonella sp.]HQT56048.1 RraA family protein [Daejeonella sp.]